MFDCSLVFQVNPFPSQGSHPLLQMYLSNSYRSIIYIGSYGVTPYAVLGQAALPIEYFGMKDNYNGTNSKWISRKYTLPSLGEIHGLE
jgi:hypothetical protein